MSSSDDLTMIIDKLKEKLNTLIELKNKNISNANCNEQKPDFPNNEDITTIQLELLDLETLATTLQRNLNINVVGESFKDSIDTSVTHIWNTIQTHSDTPAAVNHGRQILKKFFKSKMFSMIQPSNYYDSIAAYISWQNQTTKCFVEQYSAKHFDGSHDDKIIEIEKAWDENEGSTTPIFLGGAARPLFSEIVTNFSALLSTYYNKLDADFTQYRSTLFDALCKLIRDESIKYWNNYNLFPFTTNNIIEQCLHYFYFLDRQNTYFINSSGSDYIPYVDLARQIFLAEKFRGSPMTNPSDHNTEWILNKLQEQCLNIRNNANQSHFRILILLTSKNRFGAYIDVDRIHHTLNERFPDKIVTLVDACQDTRSFKNVDIIVYSKHFSTTGGIALVNNNLLDKHSGLRTRMKTPTNFPVELLAQVFININMINTGVAFGVEDLVNSANWHNWRSPVIGELRSVFDDYHQGEKSSTSIKIKKDIVQYEFTEDDLGTIVMLTLLNQNDDEEKSLSRLMSKLKEEGHSLDSFQMHDPFLTSQNAINVKNVEDLIENQDLVKLRAVEAKSSTHLAWPLVPFSVIESSDKMIKSSGEMITMEHFRRCQAYHRCLRISIDRSGHRGKLKRFVDIVQQTVENNRLMDVTSQQQDFPNYTSQWPST